MPFSGIALADLVDSKRISAPNRSRTVRRPGLEVRGKSRICFVCLLRHKFTGKEALFINEFNGCWNSDRCRNRSKIPGSSSRNNFELEETVTGASDVEQAKSHSPASVVGLTHFLFVEINLVQHITRVQKMSPPA
jgi:hypothetical protein